MAVDKSKRDVERGRRIKWARKQVGVSQAKVASEWFEGSVSRGAVANWEQGGGITPDHLKVIESEGSVPYMWLAFNQGTPPVGFESSASADELQAPVRGIQNTISIGHLPTGDQKLIRALVKRLGPRRGSEEDT